MAIYILKRLGLALVTLWLLSVLVFFACQVLPGDPGRAILGNLASPSAVAALDHQLGVDRPLVVQYWTWITGLLHGNMGESTQFRTPVEPYIKAALVNSIKLAALAFVIVVPLGIVGGVVAALNYGRAADRVISVAGLSATTVPEFVSGIVVIVVPSNESVIVEPAWKPAPVTITDVPTGPDAGFKVRVGDTAKEAVATFVPSVAERE